jgi:hypothetical protein
MNYDTVVKTFIVLLHRKICLDLCIYDLFHILPSFWHIVGSMECMYLGIMYVCVKILTHSVNNSKTHVFTLIYVMHMKQNIRLAILFAI